MKSGIRRRIVSSSIEYWWNMGDTTVAPTVQALNLVTSDVTDNKLTLSWTRGNGSFVIVLGKAGSAVNSNPVDNTTYTANAAFGSGTQIGTGNYVLYIGTGTSVNLTALSAATTYHFRAYEFNGTAGSEKYFTDTATNNPISQLTWTSLVSGLDSSWGTVRWNKNYTGPAVRVKRSSDSTETDINFLANDKCDVTAFNAFASGGGTITYTVIYDQVNALNLTLEATFLEPIAYVDDFYNNLAISMERSSACSMINAAFSCNSRTLTVYTMAMGIKESTSTESFFLVGNAGTGDDIYYRTLNNQRTVYDGTNRNLSPLEITDSSDVNVHSYRANATNTRINVDNYTLSTVSAVTNATKTSFRVGRWSGSATLDSKQDFYGWVVYQSVLSDVNDTANVSAIHQRFNKSVNYTDLIIFFGDSIVGGRQPVNTRNTLLGQNLPARIKQQYDSTKRVVNSGVGGNTVAQMNTAINARVINIGTFQTYSKKICVIMGGTNDLDTGTAPATILTTIQTMASTLRAAGWIVLVGTIIPRGTLSPGEETNRQTLNASIVLNSGGWHDGAVDYAAGAWNTGTMFAASEGVNYIHPNNLGYQLMYPIAKTALDLVL